jgi:hypothetical protein
MPDPELVVHLLVPNADRGSLLTDASDASRLPVVVPELEPGDTVVTGLQRHLRRAWGADPIFLETHLPPPPTPDDGYVGLAVLDVPPTDWAPPPGLDWGRGEPAIPERIRARARVWMDEWRAGAEPSRLRPRWSRPGWHARASAWIADQLEDARHEPPAGIEMRRLWGISVLMRAATGGGDVWFKSVFPHFHHEPAVTALLAQLRPWQIPPVIATHTEEGWLLMDAAGSPLRDDSSADVDVIESISVLADLQASTRNTLTRFESLGCPRRPLRDLVPALRRAVDESEALGGHRISPERAAKVIRWVADRASWLDGLGFPDILVHGDFHPGNVLRDAGRLRIIDWSDAAIAHPVMEIAPWFGEVRPEIRPAGWTAWLDAFARLGNVAELRDRESDAFALACAYQVVSYAGILRGLEPANRYQVADGFRGYWQDLDARVA